MEFTRTEVKDCAFYTMKTKNTRVFLDYTTVLYGNKFEHPTFSKPRRKIQFVKKHNNSTGADALFVTKCDIGAVFADAKFIYISKPVYYQILMLCEKYLNFHMHYEDKELGEDECLVEINDEIVEKFKRKAIFVNVHEELQFLDFQVYVLSSGTNLGFVNYKFIFDSELEVVDDDCVSSTVKQGNDKFVTSIVYCTSYCNVMKTYKKADELTCDYLVINKIEKEMVVGNKSVDQNMIPMVDEFKVRKDKIKDVNELCKVNNITDKKLVEKKEYYDLEENKEKGENENSEKVKETTSEDFSIVDINSSDKNVDQLVKFNTFLRNVMGDYRATVFIKYDLGKNFMDLSCHVLSSLAHANVNIYVVMQSFDRFYNQINNQSEWLQGDYYGEPFSYKSYRNFCSLENLNHDFPEKQKIIFVDKQMKIHELYAHQKVVYINYTYGETKFEKENGDEYWFYVKIDSCNREIKEQYEDKTRKIFMNEDKIRFKTVKKYIDLKVNEHVLVQEDKIFVNGILGINDFESKNKVEYLVKNKEHWLSKKMLENEYFYVDDIIVFTKLKEKYAVRENGTIERVETL